VSEIRIYVEGGRGKESRADFRRAFSVFLDAVRGRAQRKGIQWRVVPSGSREETYEAFVRALRDHPAAHVFLLVDAERPVASPPREHLAGGEDRWELSTVTDDQCHLMAEVMESWFLADPGALEAFYRQGFVSGQIPKRNNVEEVPKAEVEAVLKSSTSKTQKGEYHKTRHGPGILESLDPVRVRARAAHCDRLFETLLEAVA
jgi:Domain of unknown function (DUF4276)